MFFLAACIFLANAVAGYFFLTFAGDAIARHIGYPITTFILPGFLALALTGIGKRAYQRAAGFSPRNSWILWLATAGVYVPAFILYWSHPYA
jgi:hypothetical protein